MYPIWFRKAAGSGGWSEGPARCLIVLDGGTLWSQLLLVKCLKLNVQGGWSCHPRSLLPPFDMVTSDNNNIGASDRIRTYDLFLRREALYPTELRMRASMLWRIRNLFVLGHLLRCMGQLFQIVGAGHI